MEDERLLLADPDRGRGRGRRVEALGVDVVRIHARGGPSRRGASRMHRPSGFDVGNERSPATTGRRSTARSTVTRAAGMKVMLT